MSEESTSAMVIDGRDARDHDMDTARALVINCAMHWRNTRAMASGEAREQARVNLFASCIALEALEQRT